MKRAGNLYAAVTDFDNLYQAARAAQRGKRYRPEVLAFNDRLEENLLCLQAELRSRTYRPGPYRSFTIHDPKTRLISAAPYRDRVVHHAVCNIVGPVFERTYVRESFANRAGKGSHRALAQVVRWCRKYRYVFQADISKYFPSIDHELLNAELRRKIKCRDTLWLLQVLVDHSGAQNAAPVQYFASDDLLAAVRRRGIPIGNLTSQHFANIYLNRFDHFVKEQLHCRGYVRYVDDFALFSNERQELETWRSACEGYLAKLRLNLHPIKSQLYATRRGVTFVGYRVLPGRIRVRSSSLRRSWKRLRRLRRTYALRQVGFDRLKASVHSWLAHVNHADSQRLKAKRLPTLVFR